MTDAAEPHIYDHARTKPDDIAFIMADGSSSLTFAEVENRSNALAGQLRAAGINPGDHVALLMENRPEFYVAIWAAQRMGIYYTPVNWHLMPDEIAYIVGNCGARILLSSPTIRHLADAAIAASPAVSLWLCDSAGPSGFAPVDGVAPDPIPYEALEGSSMVYSSGTSGRPKGVKRKLEKIPFGIWAPTDGMTRGLFEFGSHTVLLIPSPLYHTAPLNFGMSAHRQGGRVVIMGAFEAESALAAIEREGVTASWMVPTMMIRLLRLPDERRANAKTGTMTHIIHSAAPCPVDTKQAMMEWLGPVLYEFYGATEGNGLVAITPHEWLKYPGSVGKSDAVRIADQDGNVMPTGEVGLIFFATQWNVFEYHDDPEKTAESRNALGWTTVGDMGYLNEDGYLFLTDRKSHMIIVGGVNIYPQETENVLATHPLIADVAVIGVPHPELGEEVKAVVELLDPSKATPETAAELIAYCRARLAKFKCPRTVDFREALPRTPAGKLLKRQIRDDYWPKTTKKI